MAPDFKTIANVRKAIGKAIGKVCRQFIVLCKQLDLFSDVVVAIDGGKIKAVNRSDRNFTDAKLKRRMAEIDSPESARLTRADIVARHGRLRRFDGIVAVITDENCASACLDFVDQIRLIPGSVQLGRATASDTTYLERTYETLPSGNLLFMPMKVWRNRVRGDGEVLVPDIPLNVDFRDDKAVRAAVTAALDRLGN